MQLWHQPLTENAMRRGLRVSLGASFGFVFCKFFELDFGVFFVVTPILLLGAVAKINANIVRQSLAAAVVSGLEVGLLAAIFSSHPLLMTMLAFLLFVYKFACMSGGSLFLFGSTGVLNLSIMLHFASYSSADLNGMIAVNIWANVVALLIALALVHVIPDRPVSPKPAAAPAAPVPKPGHRRRHEALLGATVATLSFVVFQVFNLNDSLSAQATTLLLLFPLHWNGALSYARKRVMGVTLGVTFGVASQLLLYNWSDQLLLVSLLLWIGLLMFSYVHAKEGGVPGLGFGGLTTLGILFGQYLSPNQDIIFSALYRVSSIVVAVIITLFVCYLVHRILNRFEATRFGY
ncbi:DUF2955 domain-containing protein [Agarivorans gilvus]|uniref:1,4-alpha-glucan-branching protein n=1 Tax=Agarivorans gilvus TaxID=680279 RepID=A0ABQ1I7E6_9ALTE|nr:DUF2955 domain-containing protein [Agarivorans gilvus]GGB20583.1 1,4-alpha-glucan-branching protein [Agarivorans gilvus]